MAPRSSFWETSTNGFCKQELRSPAQRGYDKALCQQGFCELPFTSSECSPKGKATFLLRVFKVGRLEEEGGACAILDTAWLMFSACLCPSLLKDFSLHSPLPGSLPWAPRSLTSPVWWPSLTHLSPLPHPTPELQLPFCIISNHLGYLAFSSALLRASWLLHLVLLSPLSSLPLLRFPSSLTLPPGCDFWLAAIPTTSTTHTPVNFVMMPWLAQ